MSQSPLKEMGSRPYEDAWQAINLLIRSDGSWSGRERNMCYRNTGDRFENVSFVSGLDFHGDGRAFAVWDMDGDGDLDLLLKFRTHPQVRMMRNDSVSSPRALVIELRGVKSNADATGARVVLRTSKGQRLAEVRSGSGFLSQSSRRVHFGLSAGEEPKEVEVRWPSGGVEVYRDGIAAGLYRIIEGARIERLPVTPRPLPVPRQPASSQTGNGSWLLERVPAPELPGELPALRGKWVLVNFWAEWCPPCRSELAELSANAAKLKANEIEVLAIAVDDFKSTKLPFRTVRADERTIELWSTLNRYLSDRRRDLGLPTSFLVDPDGRIAKIYRGVTTAAEVAEDTRNRTPPLLPFPGEWHVSQPVRNYNALATALAEKGFSDYARGIFELALQKGQDSHEILNNYAGLLASGDPEAAASLLERVVQQAPNDPSGHVNLARALARIGDSDRAVEHVRKALALEPDDYAAWAFLAELQSSSGQSKNALTSWENAIRYGGERAAFLNEIGIIHAQSGDGAAAQQAFERAAAVEPRDTASQVNLAFLHLQSGNTESARAALERARALGERGNLFFLLDAQTLMAEGKTAEAERTVAELLRRDPEYAPAQELFRRLQQR